MVRPRVLLDGMQLRFEHGAARTLKEILPAITGAVDEFETMVVTTREAAPMLAGFDAEPVVAPLTSNMLWEQVGLPLYGRKVGAKAVYSHRSCGPTSGPPTLMHFLDDPQEVAARGATAATSRERLVRLYQRLTIGPALRHASVVATFTEASAQGLRARFGRTLRRVEVVPLGVNTSKFYPDPEAGSTGSLFHLGSGEPRDQTELVVRAYARAVEEAADLPPLVIGGSLGPREAAVRSAADQGGVRDRVVYMGHIREEAVLRGAYSNAAICIQPSLYESFGLTTLEAVACGAPLVIVEEPAVQEVVGDAAVVVVRRSDPAALADAIVRLWNDPEERQRLAKAGPERAARYTWSETGVKVAQLLAELVNG